MPHQVGNGGRIKHDKITNYSILLIYCKTDKNLKFYNPKGCKHCDGTGYKGRTGIFELLVVSEAAKKLVLTKASSSSIEELARKEGMITLWEDGLEKVKAGITTVEEVAKVTREEETT